MPAMQRMASAKTKYIGAGAKKAYGRMKELNDLKMRNKFLAACTFEYTTRNMAK